MENNYTFNNGDMIICINNDNQTQHLTINKSYRVEECYYLCGDEYVLIRNEFDSNVNITKNYIKESYSCFRFKIDLKEERRKKLKKLNSI
jgi:hypothetical protein